MNRVAILTMTGLLAVLGGAAWWWSRPTLLFETRSDWNDSIRVEEDRQGRRALRFGRGGATQTLIDPDDPSRLLLPYAHGMVAGWLAHPKPHRALLVGLGGGAIPSFVRQFWPNVTMDAVEVDEEVVKVARDWFNLPDHPSLNVFVADGRAFVETREEGSYDVVLLDAFGTDAIPRHLATSECLTAIRDTLRPGGVVVANLWGPHANDDYDAMIATYLELFAAVVVLPVRGRGNRIVVAAQEELSGEPWRSRAKAFDVGHSQHFLTASFLDDLHRPIADAEPLRDRPHGE